MTTTARIVLYQLACTADDSASNSAPYVTEADAKQGEIDLARIWMAGRLDARELRRMIGEGDIETEREAHAVSDLDDLEDEAVLDLARDRINFVSSIDPVFLDVPLAFLTDAIRAAGAAAAVFTVEDVADRFDGDRDDAADWLRNNRRNIEDILSSRGNEAIDDLLMADGLYDDQEHDEDEDDEEETAMRERGVTPEAFAEQMADHTAFIFGYGADVSKVRDPGATRYATLESIRAEMGMRRAVIYEIRTEPDERGFNEVVKVHARH